MGLGVLPDAPIVWYLARSTSALYAGFGGLFWTISFDPVRYRPVLRYVGAGLLLFGLCLLVIDSYEGMPPFWTRWEGPVVAAFGATVLALTSAAETPRQVS